MPASVQVGDTVIAFFTANTLTPTYTAPTGWTLLETQRRQRASRRRAWTKTATAADEAQATQRVLVTSSAYAKSDLTVVAYRNIDGTTPIATSASKIDNAAGAAHTSPAVTAANDTELAGDLLGRQVGQHRPRWTAPAGVTVRQAVAHRHRHRTHHRAARPTATGR